MTKGEILSTSKLLSYEPLTEPHFWRVLQYLLVIKDEIRTVILANEPGGNYPEIEAIEWEKDERLITLGLLSFYKKSIR